MIDILSLTILIF